MTLADRARRWAPDPFIAALLAAVALASLLPVTGRAAAVYDGLTTAAVALLFLLHGAKLSREAVFAGAGHWRLHCCVLLTTFLVFPLLGLVLRPALGGWLTPELVAGLMFVCVVPSTVQSSISFTSIARGNVPAAVCSASASNLIGVFATPLLASLLIAADGEAGASLQGVVDILLKILLPFVVGQALRRWIGDWIGAHPRLVRFVDQGAIVMVVYGAFSASVVDGLWQRLSLSALLIVTLVVVLLLAAVLLATFAFGRRFFEREDEIVLVFCGSKKSLASGVPIANVLFTGAMAGSAVLPLMLFHQLQLFACVFIARRYARRPEAVAEPG